MFKHTKIANKLQLITHSIDVSSYFCDPIFDTKTTRYLLTRNS